MVLQLHAAPLLVVPLMQFHWQWVIIFKSGVPARFMVGIPLRRHLDNSMLRFYLLVCVVHYLVRKIESCMYQV